MKQLVFIAIAGCLALSSCCATVPADVGDVKLDHAVLAASPGVTYIVAFEDFSGNLPVAILPESVYFSTVVRSFVLPSIEGTVQKSKVNMIDRLRLARGAL